MKKEPKTIQLKTSNCVVAIIVAILTLLVIFFSGFLTAKSCSPNVSESASWAISMIEKYGCYFDSETGEIISISPDTYAKTIVNNLLDKYSEYFTNQEFLEYESEGKGNMSGFGVVFSAKEDDPIVFETTFNSPAYKSGIEKGDLIKGFVIDGDEIKSEDKAIILSFLVEVENDKEVTFIIDRKGEEKRINVKKEAYVKSYIKYSDNELSAEFLSEGNVIPKIKTSEKVLVEGLDDESAYILFTSFEGDAANEMKEVLDLMKERGRKKLILDLRGNGGGYMETLSQIVSYFIPTDPVTQDVVFAISKDKNLVETPYKTAEDNFYENIEKIVIMANENTASASECLMGAMIYYEVNTSLEDVIIENETIKGSAKTYGKGIMQSHFVNPYSGEAIKLTTAFLYWPDGETCIHGKGIEAINSYNNDVDAMNAAIEKLNVQGI